MLNYEETGKHAERITKLNLSKRKERIMFHLEKNDWKKFEKNNVTVAFNVLLAKREIIFPVYVSKHNSNREKKIIFLMISNAKKLWHYLAVKKAIRIIKRSNL